MPNSKRTHLISVSADSALFIVFLVLKLVGAIDWSWWWVTAPLWLPLAAILAVVVALGIIAVVTVILEDIGWRHRQGL